MPSILIEIKRSYTQEQEVAIMDAVHHAMVEAFKIKPTDRHVRLIVHETVVVKLFWPHVVSLSLSFAMAGRAT